ncbi:MAG: zinc metalloprotease [Bdellovibrionaceae bacterium]|nr:zinc metalloprotease [Pseudobdellovibrionaceae bacterium]
MKLFVFLGLFLVSLSANAKISSLDMSVASRCSTADIDPLDQLLVENQLNSLRAKRNFARINVRDLQALKIPVYIHVLAQDKTTAGGNVSDAKLKEQIDYLNASYASMNISFEIVSIDRKIDKNWFTFAAGEETIKGALHQGDAGSLNLYIAGIDGGVLGWSSFPWEYSTVPDMDGVVIHYQTLPGGELKEYNEGGTTVHEVGHWLGLYHVFQGGCSDGDFVVDTPAQSKPNFGCPTVVPDTCSTDGEDSIHNFMDYSDDICLNGFSTGQMQRAHDSFASYRN